MRILLAVLFVATPAFAQEAKTLKDALARGEPTVEVLYRYERVEDDDFVETAHASTLRTLVGYRTLPYRGVSLFVQAQNVAPVFNDDSYNNTGAGHLANGVTDRPVVADPTQTRMQQVYLRLDAFDTAADLGRREIFYGNHRFIGNVGWRQNHQTFDAVHLSNHSLEKTTVSYTYADRVIRINGGDKDMSSHFLNGEVKLDDALSVELFGYLLDYRERQEFGFSTRTFGFRFHGARPLSERYRALFEAEYARQSDFKDNPADYGVNYLELMGGVGFGEWVNVKVGRELLGAAGGGRAFQTPLATLHQFNGWADQFLVTPANGIVDRYVSADGKLRGLSWLVRYHDFSADDGGASYGSEVDAMASYPTPWQQVFGAKVALYRADGFSSDTSKLWLWTHYRF